MEQLIPLFLQKVLEEQILEAKRLNQIYEYFCTRCNIDTHDLPLSRLLDTVNIKLLPLDLEIRSSVDQSTDTKVYILISLSHTNSEHKFIHFKGYSTLEFQYLMVLVEKIINSGINKLYVTKEEAAQLKVKYETNNEGNTQRQQEEEEEEEEEEEGADRTSNFPPTRKDGLKLVEKFSKDYWLSEYQWCDGVALGPRLLTELQFQLNERYPQTLKFCARCSTLVTKGFGCNLCFKPFHLLCLQPYQKKSNLSHPSKVERCPQCSNQWQPTRIGNLILEVDEVDNQVESPVEGSNQLELSFNSENQTQETPQPSPPTLIGVKREPDEDLVEFE